jgi:predicted AlkP superfamily phosphohydrolase/phosphomutase
MRRVAVLGLDGFDPRITEALLARGALPNLAALRARGGYSRLATTYPAQTPVAWSTFATGLNPGGHGIFDFLRRDPANYRIESGLFRFEQPRRFLPPKVVNLRGGTAVWERLADAGVPAVVLRHPCTYPPDRLRGRMLSGVGVPDVRGGFGTATWYEEGASPEAFEGERRGALRREPDGSYLLELLGPPASRGGGVLSLELRFVPAAGGAGGALHVEGTSASLTLRMGEWSDWLAVRFSAGLLQTVHGRVRFLLTGTAPLRLYATPVAFDPHTPLFPISEPWEYAAGLERAIGPYHTLGMPEEHNALNNGRIDEAQFLAQCDDIMRERTAMLHHELDRFDEGLLFCLFDTPDRLQHMFWRYRDPRHPLHQEAASAGELAGVIEDHYRACDAVVGGMLDCADDDTLLLVLSDHGFTDFRRELHLNAWLHAHGYLTLRTDADPDEVELLGGIDWARTRAYAAGMAGIYLNRRGREAEGCVAPEMVDEELRALAGALSGLTDDADGAPAVRSVLDRRTLYSGAAADDAPDLIVNTVPGYRVSSRSALGGVGHALFSDNRRRWSGDHVVDPEAVPGVLFSNRPITARGAGLADLAPTLLAALGVPADPAHEGRSVFLP